MNTMNAAPSERPAADTDLLRSAYRLGAHADTDWRTALRALRFGLKALRSRTREQISKAAADLHIELTSAAVHAVEPATEAADLRARALLLAAATELDPRTCMRALRLGLKAIRAAQTRRLILVAAADLQIELPEGRP